MADSDGSTPVTPTTASSTRPSFPRTERPDAPAYLSRYLERQARGPAHADDGDSDRKSGNFQHVIPFQPVATPGISPAALNFQALLQIAAKQMLALVHQPRVGIDPDLAAHVAPAAAKGIIFREVATGIRVHHAIEKQPMQMGARMAFGAVGLVLQLRIMPHHFQKHVALDHHEAGRGFGHLDKTMRIGIVAGEASGDLLSCAVCALGRLKQVLSSSDTVKSYRWAPEVTRLRSGGRAAMPSEPLGACSRN